MHTLSFARERNHSGQTLLHVGPSQGLRCLLHTAEGNQNSLRHLRAQRTSSSNTHTKQQLHTPTPNSSSDSLPLIQPLPPRLSPFSARLQAAQRTVRR